MKYKIIFKKISFLTVEFGYFAVPNSENDTTKDSQMYVSKVRVLFFSNL